MPEGEVPLLREIARFPYVPSDPRVLDQRCFEAYNIQVHGLMKRLSSSGHSNVWSSEFPEDWIRPRR